MKIGFIGCGKMACAIMKGFIKTVSPKDIIMSDIIKEALKKTKNETGVEITQNNSEVIEKSDIIFMAVKPFKMREILSEIKSSVNSEKLIVSIAAGISTETIEGILGENTRVIRVMPNTPALVNAGISAVCRGKNATEEDRDIVVNLLNSIGKTVKLDEDMLNIVTAISGSGPAYFYRFIEDFAKSGEKLGLDYKTSLLLAAQTALGSAKMIMETNVSPEQLIINVTTPGGCTAEGNKTLEENNIKQIIEDTVVNTMNKAIELGK